MGTKPGAPLGRPVVPLVTPGRGRGGAGRGEHALSRARAAQRDRCRVPAPRRAAEEAAPSGQRRRRPGRAADPAGLESGGAMGTGAGGPGVLALLFAVCAPFRLQAEELGE